MTSAPATQPGSGGGLPLPPAPVTGDPPLAAPSSVRMPTQLPRTGGFGDRRLERAGLVAVLIFGGLALCGRSRLAG